MLASRTKHAARPALKDTTNHADDNAKQKALSQSRSQNKPRRPDVSLRRCYSGPQFQTGRRTLKPRKLIISRKGSDSGSGGCPSPIFPDGTMFSLTIPSGDEEAFEDLQLGDIDIASVVAGVTNGRMNGLNLVHLEPDLNFNAYRYRKDRPDWQQWRGMLGQAGIAQSHLNKQIVGSGDVFLFFGLYRRVEETAQSWRFVRGAPELHVLWGWLQIDQKYRVGDLGPNDLPRARHHPHLYSRYHDDRNTVYAAAKFELNQSRGEIRRKMG